MLKDPRIIMGPILVPEGHVLDSAFNIPTAISSKLRPAVHGNTPVAGCQEVHLVCLPNLISDAYSVYWPVRGEIVIAGSQLFPPQRHQYVNNKKRKPDEPFDITALVGRSTSSSRIWVRSFDTDAQYLILVVAGTRMSEAERQATVTQRTISVELSREVVWRGLKLATGSPSIAHLLQEQTAIMDGSSAVLKVPAVNGLMVARAPGAAADDDDIMLSTTRVKMTDPVMFTPITHPVRGLDCKHIQVWLLTCMVGGGYGVLVGGRCARMVERVPGRLHLPTVPPYSGIVCDITHCITIPNS